jgi:hypothetical protein
VSRSPRSRVDRALGAAIAATAVSFGACAQQPPARSEPTAQAESGAQPSTLAIYALSRGKGVPPETREAFDAARRLLESLREEHKVTRIVATRIGIEGERRLCAEFADSKVAKETHDKLLAMSKSAELLNIVAEPCEGNVKEKGETP